MQLIPVRQETPELIYSESFSRLRLSAIAKCFKHGAMEKLRRLSLHWVKFEILVHLPEDSQMVSVMVRPGNTIKDIRVDLVKQGITSWKKCFSYNGRELGEHETIKDLNIKSGAVLLLVHKNER